MSEQNILDNAPKGATHFIQQTLSVVYFKYNKQIPLHWCNDKKGWRGSLYFEFNNFRLLADISKIAELEKALATSFEFLSFSRLSDCVFYENHKHLIKEQE